MEVKSTSKVYGGILTRYTHKSNETKTNMTFSLFLPSINSKELKSIPYIIYLSGLTCTDENVCQKSNVFNKLTELGIAFVAPDTSPRGANIEGEEDSWDFGTGAGFYLDATSPKWANNYRMYSYITKELPDLLKEHFPILDQSKVGITGHSMGGHGALTIALKNPNLYKSVSAFAPICNPSQCPWGIKAFNNYLSNTTEWKQYDATELLLSTSTTASLTNHPSLFRDILIDVGTVDSFYIGKQLLPEAFQEAADKVNQKITLRYQDGYDHSYYFISTFINEHIQYHWDQMNN